MNDSHFSPNHQSQPKLTRSGLTLVLPPLTSGKLKKGHSKPKATLNQHDLVPVDIKLPRPVKLKPLKEVLSRLITLIKKKDDYAFFLKPVDLSAVPGYSDVIKRPMDLGTMTNKVNNGRYRSLEEFATDLRLVTTNAKTFNPQGTIYHSEADRIEAWGLDQIAKASSTVIEYETDWNIEIEQDDDGVNNDQDDNNPPPTPMDVDGDEASMKGRSPSVQVQGGEREKSRRGTRGPYMKKSQLNNTVTTTETIGPDGRLPGSKDGVGAFPPGSDWAEMMVQLKIKGKRYKTKKERMRIEKGGPPYAADGSLDYSEMEDPFTILSALVPEPLTRPQLIPLYPVAAVPSQYQYQHQPDPAPAATNISLKRSIDHLTSSSPHQQEHPQPKRRKHWSISRNVSSRYKPKDDDIQDRNIHEEPAREPLPVDWGSFAWLNGEMPRGYSEDGVLADVRSSLGAWDIEEKGDGGNGVGVDEKEDDYWSLERAKEGEGYIRDIVYGGADGLAYVRSLAEFVSGSPVEMGDLSGLGMPLAEFVRQHEINPLTNNLHEVFYQASLHLSHLSPLDQQGHISHSQSMSIENHTIQEQIERCLTTYPRLFQLLRILKEQLDMASLIRRPEEIYESEGSWVGRDYVPPNRIDDSSSDGKGEGAVNSAPAVDSASNQGPAFDSPEVLAHVMDYTARAIIEVDQKIRRGQFVKHEGQSGEMDQDEEDPVIRKLRLNLLALAKRAPLDKIARLPKELVPVHIRHFVPTIGP